MSRVGGGEIYTSKDSLGGRESPKLPPTSLKRWTAGPPPLPLHPPWREPGPAGWAQARHERTTQAPRKRNRQGNRPIGRTRRPGEEEEEAVRHRPTNQEGDTERQERPRRRGAGTGGEKVHRILHHPRAVGVVRRRGQPEAMAADLQGEDVVQ